MPTQVAQLAPGASRPVVKSNDAPVKWLLLRAQIGRYLILLKRMWWIPVLTVAAGFGIALLVISHAPPSFLSVGRMMVSGRINFAGDNSGYTEELQNFYGTQIELMTSGEVRNNALAQVQSLHPEVKPVPVDFSVGQTPKAAIFILRAVASDAVFAQYYLDACMDEYVRSKREMRNQKSGTTLAALTEELGGVEKQMRSTDDQLLSFQQKYNLGYLKEEGNSAGLYLATLNRQLADLKTEYNLLQTLNLEQNLDRQPNRPDAPASSTASSQDPFWITNGPGADFLRAQQQLKLLQAERDQLAEYMRPRHPDIIRYDEEIQRTNRIIQELRKQATEQIASRRDGIKVQIDNLTSVIKEWEEKAVNLSREIAQYDKLRSNSERLKADYDRLYSSTRSLDITRTVDQDMVSILERASPAVSIKPGLEKALLAGLVGGFLVGCLILVIIDRVDDRLTSVLYINMHFTEQILGQVMEEAHPGDRLRLLQDEDSRHGFAESFRNFRSSLLFMPFEGERPKTLLITSAIPNEGKSTITSNLAIALAQSGAKTLLVDGDLRRGGLHRAFDRPNDRGFSEVIMGLNSWQQVILPTAYPNLSLMPRGRSTTKGSEHLLSPITDHFLREAYPDYDHIIFDSSPVLVSDDTTSFAPKVDAVITVIRFNHSSSRLTRRIIELLKHRQANVIGLVINAVDSSTPEYGYYKYKDYYVSPDALDKK